MNLQEAINNLRAPQGVTTMIGALLSGDSKPVHHSKGEKVPLKIAEAKLADLIEKQNNCGSDWAWWGYNGEIVYWKALVCILKAAKITGNDNLPDIDTPKYNANSAVMDLQGQVEGYGKRILLAAQRKEHVKELEKVLQCNCDLDRWEPKRSTGHSHVCRIHKRAMEWKPNEDT